MVRTNLSVYCFETISVVDLTRETKSKVKNLFRMPKSYYRVDKYNFVAQGRSNFTSLRPYSTTVTTIA